MLDQAQLRDMNAEQLRTHAMELMAQVHARDSELRYKDARIAQITHEMAVLRRWKFGRQSEQFDSSEASLLEESLDADIAAIELELEGLYATQPESKMAQKPRRASLPPELPRTDIRHEPDSSTCQCGCGLQRIGEDVGEKLDKTPGVLTVERHIRSKWVCRDVNR